MSMEIREVAPGDLIVAANVRRDVALTKEFVASVKQHGVKVPVLVQEGPTGLEVLDGQRRTLAAVEAGLSVVPVVVQAVVADDGQRIVDQLVVNEHRSGLSSADQVEAIRDLALFGLSATAIAKKVGEKKATVDVALKVAAVPAAVEVMREKQVSLEDAAMLAEVAEVDEEFAAELGEKLAKGYNVGYDVREWRFERAKAAAMAEIEAAGVEVVEPLGYDADDPRAVRDLFLDEAFERRMVELDESEVKQIAGDGLVAFVTWGWGGADRNDRVVEVEYGVRGWRERGLFGRDRSAYASKPAAPATPEEAESLKAERRAARERTKAWEIATQGRLVFLQALLQRKTLPAGWDLQVALLLCRSSSNFNWSMAKGLLQASEQDGEYTGYLTLRRLLSENPARAAHVALAVALAEREGGRDFDRKGWQSDGVADYLRLLDGWGYQLTGVEREVVDGAQAA